MFVVGRFNACRFSEIKAAHDANSFRHIPVNAYKLDVVSSRDQAAVKIFIPGGHFSGIRAALLYGGLANALREEPGQRPIVLRRARPVA